MYETIKKFLDEGGKCLLIENGKPIGVILTMGEYELLQKQTKEAESEKKTEPITKESINDNPIGKAIANEVEFSGVSANIDEINLADAESVTLEDLGLDELPY